MTVIVGGWPYDEIARERAYRPRFAYHYVGATSAVSRQLAAEQALRDRVDELGIAYASRSRPHDLRDYETRSATPLVATGPDTTGTTGSGSTSGSGPPTWWKNWVANHGGRFGGSRPIRISGGSSGGRLLGPNALGQTPLLGNVPAGATSSGPSPILLIGIVAVAGVGGYLLWHKLRMSRAEDKQLDQGKETGANAA